MKPQTESVRAPIYWSTLYGSFDLPTHKTYMNSTTHYGRSRVPTNIGLCCELPERNKNHYEMIGLPSKHATTCRKLEYHILLLLPPQPFIPSCALLQNHSFNRRKNGLFIRPFHIDLLASNFFLFSHSMLLFLSFFFRMVH